MTSHYDPYLDPETLVGGRTVPATKPSKEQYVKNLVAALKDKQEMAANAERVAKELAAQVRELIYTEIPDAMDDAELETLKLPDGSTLSLDLECIPEVKVEDEDKAWAWMREHGYADKLKTEVTVYFGMGQDELADRFCRFLATSLGDQERQRRTYIHDQTARAWGRMAIEEGLSLPPEISIFPLRRIKIVRGRKSTGEQDGS